MKEYCGSCGLKGKKSRNSMHLICRNLISGSKVKAGLTGYAQVYGKYNTSPYDKLKMDLAYIEGYSLWLDIKIILMTIKVLFTRESSQGLSDDAADQLLRRGEKQQVRAKQ